MNASRRDLLALLGLGALASRAARPVQERKRTAMSEWTPAQFQEWSETMRRNSGAQASRSAIEALGLVERCSAVTCQMRKI